MISVSKLHSDVYDVSFGSRVTISKHDNIICHGALVNSLYIISMTCENSISLSSSSSDHKRRKVSSLNKTYLWHLRLGYININRIQRLVKEGSLVLPQVEPFPACESCLEGKMTTRLFKADGYRAKDMLELIHSNLCGPMSVQAHGGYEYFVTFIDDYSRYGYVYLFLRKSECFDSFKTFQADVKR